MLKLKSVDYPTLSAVSFIVRPVTSVANPYSLQVD